MAPSKKKKTRRQTKGKDQPPPKSSRQTTDNEAASLEGPRKKQKRQPSASTSKGESAKRPILIDLRSPTPEVPMTVKTNKHMHYPAPSPAILGFGWEEEQAWGKKTQTEEPPTRPNVPRYSYKPVSQAILQGFDDVRLSREQQHNNSIAESDKNRRGIVPARTRFSGLELEAVLSGYAPVSESILSLGETRVSDPVGGRRRPTPVTKKENRRADPAPNTPKPKLNGAPAEQYSTYFQRFRDNAAGGLFGAFKPTPNDTPAETPAERNNSNLYTLRSGDSYPKPNTSGSPETNDSISLREFMFAKFGQRYLADNTNGVTVSSRQRLQVPKNGLLDCIVCAERKEAAEFPGFSITKTCSHSPQTCLDCVAVSIRTDLTTKLWSEVKCTECPELLGHDDIQRFADFKTFQRYESLSFRSALSESENFLWCTSGCGHGQVHEGGLEQPIVTCMLCNSRSCFYHKVAWHENMACSEYDAFLADPENFRSLYDLQNEEAELEAEARRRQEEDDREYARKLMQEEQQAAVLERAKEEDRRRKEREAKEAAAKRERDKIGEEKKQAAARRHAEDKLAQATILTTTKACPKCKAPIEKNRGCSHMTCLGCKYEFCYDCLADYKKILDEDNSVHGKDCRWHPDNMSDGADWVDYDTDSEDSEDS